MRAAITPTSRPVVPLRSPVGRISLTTTSTPTTRSSRWRPPPRATLGASPGPRTFAAIADWGDGWFPVPFWGHTPNHAAELHRTAESRGRDPGELAVIVDGVLVDPAMIDPWAEAETPVEAVLVALPSLPLDDLLPQLDAAAALVVRYR